jgi:predicted nucleic acid-binding protein
VKYLVDSNVLSEAMKPAPDSGVVDWLRRNEHDLAVNPIVLGEIEYGILLLPSGKRRLRLQQWFAQGVQRIRVLDFDGATAAEWVRLLARLKKANRAMSVKDSLIAASALKHGLRLATRNVGDFAHCGVSLVNLFVP